MHQWGMCAQKEPDNKRKILSAERSDRNRLENATGLHAKVFLFWPLYCTALQCQPSASQKTTYFPTHPYHEYSYHKQHTMKKPWQMEVACSPFHHVSYFCYSPFQKRGGKKSFAQPWNVENPQLYYSTLGVIFAATMFSYHIAENKQTKKYWPDCKKPCPYPVILEQVSCLWKTVLSAPASLIDLFWRWK